MLIVWRIVIVTLPYDESPYVKNSRATSLLVTNCHSTNGHAALCIALVETPVRSRPIVSKAVVHIGNFVTGQLAAVTVLQTFEMTVFRAIFLVQSVFLPNIKPRERPYWHQRLESFIIACWITVTFTIDAVCFPGTSPHPGYVSSRWLIGRQWQTCKFV